MYYWERMPMSSSGHMVKLKQNILTAGQTFYFQLKD